MAKLFFHYSAMNAGKTTSLLQVAYNYRERDMRPYLLLPEFDSRSGFGIIGSRIGISAEARTYRYTDNLLDVIEEAHHQDPIACVLIDEAQFLTPSQVDQLSFVVDTLKIPVMCYGLRTDFQGELFPGSARLLALADEIREIKTICWCGKKATMVLRVDDQGKVVSQGDKIQIGGNAHYHSVCRKHWRKQIYQRSDVLEPSLQSTDEEVCDYVDIASD